MRYFVAAIISIVLIILLVMIANWGLSWAKIYQDFGVTLSPIERAGFKLAYFIRVYWYILALLLLGISLMVAALGSRAEEP